MNYQTLLIAIASADLILSMRFEPNYHRRQKLEILKTTLTAAHEKGTTDFSAIYQCWLTDNATDTECLYREAVQLLNKAFLPSNIAQCSSPLGPVSAALRVSTRVTIDLSNNYYSLRASLLDDGATLVNRYR